MQRGGRGSKEPAGPEVWEKQKRGEVPEVIDQGSAPNNNRRSRLEVGGGNPKLEGGAWTWEKAGANLPETTADWRRERRWRRSSGSEPRSSRAN